MKEYEATAKGGEGALGPTRLRMMTLKKNQLQKAYLDRWQASGSDGKRPLDGIIMAVTPWAAARLGTTQENSYVGYTGVANLLGESDDAQTVASTDLTCTRSASLYLPRHIRRQKARSKAKRVQAVE